MHQLAQVSFYLELDWTGYTKVNNASSSQYLISSPHIQYKIDYINHTTKPVLDIISISFSCFGYYWYTISTYGLSFSDRLTTIGYIMNFMIYESINKLTLNISIEFRFYHNLSHMSHNFDKSKL